MTALVKTLLELTLRLELPTVFVITGKVPFINKLPTFRSACKSRVELVSVKEFNAFPRLEPLLTANVPALRVVLPVYVFTPLNTTLPVFEPVFISREFEPTELIAPFNVKICPVGAFIVVGPAKEIALFNVMAGPFDCSITPFNDMEPVPKALLLLTSTVAPFVAVVFPEIKLGKLKLYVPDAFNTKLVAVIN